MDNLESPINQTPGALVWWEEALKFITDTPLLLIT